ncbi:MAG: DNA polymerase IV [Thermodesulfovibrionales bacterium]|nr:DNA polymerase IV [Thermodesulfovibrionales bacterium]
MNEPLTICSWPKAILHVDADAFFASCEQALNPALRGKPVVTGLERGIVAAASYEAKARGIKRGMRIGEVKRICPDAIILPSDYETYSLMSVRLFEILRRFSPVVEEYSIDEAFADLTGLRRIYHSSYEEIGRKIQETVHRDLGITVSIGISLTKVLAKIASKHKKPAGLTAIPGREIHLYLKNLPVSEVWGIGPNTSAYLEKLGIKTALEFARKDEAFIKKHLSKPFHEIWHELNGRSIYPVVSEKKESYKSISKARTFTPPSDDKEFVYAQLSRNLENACIKARRYNLAAKRIILFLRTQEFRDEAIELRLQRASAYPAEILPLLREGFERLYKPHVLYRQTGVILSELQEQMPLQPALFEEPLMIEKMERLYSIVDQLSKRFGKHVIIHGSSLEAIDTPQHQTERGTIPERKKELLKGENSRQRLGIPLLRIKSI